MPRIWIMGCSGSGKSTLARSIHRKTGIAWLELDALQHQADWKPLAPEAFRARVSEFMDLNPDWIVDGNYQTVADLVEDECTDVVWIDVPLSRVVWRLALRSLRRIVLRTELWNGNRESLRALLSRDPGESVILWAIRTHDGYSERFERLRKDPRLRDKRFHRLTGARSKVDLIRGLTSSGCDSPS